jgi:hypothetical protein
LPEVSQCHPTLDILTYVRRQLTNVGLEVLSATMRWLRTTALGAAGILTTSGRRSHSILKSVIFIHAKHGGPTS